MLAVNRNTFYLSRYWLSLIKLALVLSLVIPSIELGITKDIKRLVIK